MKKIVIEDTIQGRIIRLTIARGDSTAAIMEKLKKRYKSLREVELVLLHEGEILEEDAIVAEAAAADGSGKAQRFELCALEAREEADQEQGSAGELDVEEPEEHSSADEEGEREEDETERSVKPLATAVDPSSNTDVALEEMKRGNFARGAAKLLAVRGLIDPKETQDLLGQVGQESGFLDLLIKSQPGLRERVILSALASAAGCQFLTSDQLDSEEKALRELQQDVASRIPALPIEIQESSLVIAVENPFNVEMMEDLELLTSRSIVPKMALRSAVLQALETAYADLDEDVPMLEPPSLARPEGADEQILSGVGEYEETMVAPPEVQQMLEQQHERQQQMLAQQKTAEDAPKGEGDEESTPAAEDEEGGASEVNPTEAACAADTAGTEKQLKVAGPQIGDPGSADEPEEARGCAAAEGEPNAEPRGTTGQPQPPEVDREPGGASEVDREPEAAPPTEQDVEEASGVESALVAAVQSVPVSAGGTEYPPDRSPTGGAGRLARQATVRYYGQMTPHQSFPLTTVIAVAQVPPPLEASGQATGGLSSMAGPAGSRLVLRPCFPGCISVPAEQMLDARSEQTTLDFWITPLVDGELADARLEVHRGEELLDVIPLPSRVVRTTWAKIALGAGILLPIIGVVFDMFGLEPRGNALARLIANSGGVLVSSLLAAAGLIVVSLCLSWVIRPKQATAQSALI